ncbi:MAG TPA: hypothetical protein VFG54_03795 [Prolixibacteraceae bacterium]|nr:hypothetical protein [Prolixibacteraceae bacterium]
MEIKELLTTYWSQVTLLLVGISFFIQRGLNIKSKKVEINHSLYQQNRLAAVNRFFGSYAKAELMWNQISIYEVLSHTIKPKEMDSIIFPTLNELKKNLFELMIYFNELDYSKFKLLYANIELINNNLISLYFDPNKENSDILKSNNFQLIKTQALQNNNKILSELSNVIKETYKT